jgi:hypothetical protein
MSLAARGERREGSRKSGVPSTSGHVGLTPFALIFPTCLIFTDVSCIDTIRSNAFHTNALPRRIAFLERTTLKKEKAGAGFCHPSGPWGEKKRTSVEILWWDQYL